MPKIDASLITANGRTVDVKFEYQHPVLRPYERRATNRLTFILDQLDLGSDANLGYTKVTWLPDELVQVRYLAMEGVLQPIIIVRVEFRLGIDETDAGFRLSQVIDELEDPPELPEEPKYIPFAWIGIHAGNHRLAGGAEGNNNANFWGWPIDPRLVGFEPTVGGIGIQRFFPSSVESFGGSLVIGSAWQARVGSAADEQIFYRVNDGQQWSMNEFGQQQGTFQDGQWELSARGLVAASRTNMLALEHLDTFVTAPPAAFGSGLSELPSNYWKRSIIIPGETALTFPTGAFSDTIDVGGGVLASVSANYSGGVIEGTVLSGRYEIGAFAHSFHCEATNADLHIRVVTGGLADDGSASSQIVYDFFPTGIGSPCSAARMEYIRVLSLGGNPPCGFSDDDRNIFGPNDGGAGWWDQSIYINIQTGSASVEPASRDAPFFGGSCNSAYQVSCENPDCASGCSGEEIVQPAHSLDYPSGFTVSFDQANEINPGVIDLRGGVLWHMARVVQTDVNTGHICFVQLLGNDGAMGGGCSECQSFSYGTMLRANGYTGLTELGIDLTGREEDPFNVGQLVTVIGWTDVHDGPCLVTGSDWRLIVTDPHGAGQDFTSLYWFDLRCPRGDGTGPVDSFFEGVEFAYANRSLCQAGALSVKCSCDSGQMRCV